MEVIATKLLSQVWKNKRRRRRRTMAAGSQSTASRTTFHLPLEITIEILSRLPVKTLLRFKSVCKNWYALIKTQDFISKHLQTLSAPNSTPLLLIKYYNHNAQNYAMSLLSNDGSSGPIDFPFLTPKNYHSVRDISFLGERTRNDFSIAGVCNGLVCINLSRFGYPLVICNPSTREFRKIPNSNWNWLDENGFNGSIGVRQVSFGFGFHPSANDYKLIRIVLDLTPMRKDNIRADLYVMSTDTWTEIDVNKLLLFFMYEFGEEYNNVVQICGSSASAVLNGVFYWPGREVPTDQMVVMSFDLGDEVFQKIRTPECLDRIWETNWKLMEFNDKLALVVSPDERGFDVWVLNENESSWTKQVKVGSFPRIAIEDGDNRVVGGGKNNELLVTEHKVSGDLKLFSYDTKTGETKDILSRDAPYQSFVYLCAETLLPVMQANTLN
ncbi:F-box/kelch-repeat protein At3g23880-like [Rhododendron vialii]|uniref:F-box/kelch-repeat protein At3g23880-like n=1 Tax=Rhododendron vialii TaxID=182163 RepID=UPI00265D933B|nr:F-box/kelch-repeat protein At3g23880-like [Rhododendron vialii]